jgi:hypothetical protein
MLVSRFSDRKALFAPGFCEGVTASFLKELLRKAALIAADQDPEGAGALTVTTSHLSAAVDILLDERNELTRLLLGATSD